MGHNREARNGPSTYDYVWDAFLLSQTVYYIQLLFIIPYYRSVTLWGPFAPEQAQVSFFYIFLFAQLFTWGFPDGTVVKNPPINAADSGSIPGWGRCPGGGNGNPLKYFLPGKCHGQASVAGWNPWGCVELDMPERLSVHYELHAIFTEYRAIAKTFCYTLNGRIDSSLTSRRTQNACIIQIWCSPGSCSLGHRNKDWFHKMKNQSLICRLQKCSLSAL